MVKAQILEYANPKMNSNFGFHSNFQVQVWTWDLRSNHFRVRTLSDLKRMVGTPKTSQSGRNTKKLEKKGRHTETSQNALRCENMVGAPKTSRKSWNTKTLKRVVDTPKWATIQSNVERNPKHKLRSSKYTSLPRARAKTTGCRSAGLGPLGSKGLALFFRRRGIHICHQNDSWNLPARVINRIPTFWLPL